MNDLVPADAVEAERPEAGGARQFLTFRVNNGLYALPGEEVSEVILIPSVARLPQSPKSLMGLANLRGSVVPVVDVRSMLGRGVFVATNIARGIVMTGTAPVVLAVDAVDALVTIGSGLVETRQAELTAEPGERLDGAFRITGDPGVVKILDIPTMLSAAFQPRVAPTREPSAQGAPASTRTVPEQPEDQLVLVSFAVAGQDYALALEAVREIVPLPETISIVPRAEAVLLGVASYRDSLLPLLSLRGLLGFPITPVSEAGEKVIVTVVGGILVGLVADQARAIIRATASQIDPAPAMLAARTGGEARVTAIYRGDGGRHLVSVLAPDRLFREDVMPRSGDPSAASATTGVPERSSSEILQFVVFRLADEEFALPIAAVDEVALVPEDITRVPKTPKFLEGVINLRGEVLPVVDQRRRFDMPKWSGGDRRRLIVVRTERHRAGVIVDSVSEVMRTSANAIEPAPDLAQDGGRLIGGVINVKVSDRMILVLDPSELLTRPERGILDKLDLDAKESDRPPRSGS